MKKYFWFLIAALVAAGIGLGVMRPWRGDSSETQRPLETARAEFRDIRATVLATGKIDTQVGAEINVGARISGRLERLHVNVGDKVQKGRIIAEIEKEDLLAAVAEHEAAVELIRVKLAKRHATGPREIARAKARMHEAEASLTYARSDAERLEQLAANGAVSEQIREKADKTYQVAQAQLAVAHQDLNLAQTQYDEGIKELKAELAKAEAALKNARVKLSYATICAPMDGVIASVSTREGETVAAGLSAPTFVTIVNLDRLQLNASVDEVDIGRVQTGQKVYFSVDAFPDIEFEGRLTAIYPQAVIQDNVVTYDCIVTIDSDYSGRLRPQMTAGVTLVVENRDHVLVLPVQAVKRRSGKSVVYRKKDSAIETVTVQTGWQDDTWIEILSGISAGDEVLLSAFSTPS